jgi:hypothetical protein
MFDIFMTPFTEEQRLALEGYHPHYPGRFQPSWVFVKFSHGLYVMHFYIFVAPAVFAEIR